MKNETKRSVAAVLLAAAMLLSTQGITAFADTEKIEPPATEITQTTEKPETPEKPAEGEGKEQEKPEEKPAEGEGEVQEKPETETPETPADPSAVAPTPLVPATPVAPEMGIEPASIEGDGDYDHTADIVTNSPRKYIWSSESFTNTFWGDQFRVILWTQSSNGTELGTIVKDDSKLFYPGTGYRIYSIKPNDPNNWVFAGWTTNLYHAGGYLSKKIDTNNLQGIAGKWAFSKDEYEKTPYDGKSSSIQVNAILPWEGGVGINVGNKLYFTLCANFNPLVTVDVGENGKVTYNGTVVDKDTTDKKVEVEYGTAPDFTITPDTGYKVASVTFGDTTIQANEDGTYTPPSVTEPTTLCVKFEKAEENIDVEDLGLGVKFECTDNDSHNSENIMLKVADKNTYYTISPVDGTTATVTINANKYLENYNTTNPNHRLVSPSEEYKIQLTLVNNTWTVDKGSTTIVTIPVTCKAEVKQIEHIEINLGDNLRKEIPFAPIYLHAEYDGYYIFLTGANKHFTTPPVSSIPDTLTTDVDDPTKAQEFFSGFTCLGWNFAFDKHYISNAYISEARVEGTTLYMTLDIPAPEAPANINELLDVTLNCENPDHPVEYGKSKTYSDLLPNSYTIGEVKNNDGTYTCDITINPEEYLADYNNVTKTNHILVTTPENLTGIATVTLKYEDGAWKTAESPVTFTVTCKESIPLTPSKPSDDVVKAIMDKISVTVDCTNTTGHDPMNHTLTGAKFTVGDIYSVAPFADQDPDPVILCPVTINNYVSLQNGFITQYNAATNESHTLSSGFIPASIVLTYNKDAQDGKGAWENHDLENITLSLTCNPTTPGGGGEGTNPGGNGGDNDNDDDRYTGGNTVTRTINDDDVPLNDRPTNTTTIDDEDVPLADLPDDTVTIDDGEVPLKANPSTGDSLPFAAMAAAALSLGGVIVLNRKKK